MRAGAYSCRRGFLLRPCRLIERFWGEKLVFQQA
jgi:hypothetical protein